MFILFMFESITTIDKKMIGDINIRPIDGDMNNEGMSKIISTMLASLNIKSIGSSL